MSQWIDHLLLPDFFVNLFAIHTIFMPGHLKGLSEPLFGNAVLYIRKFLIA